MKRIITGVTLSPFLIVTLYWVIDKYIYFLFDIKDRELTTLITTMLTLLVAMGIGTLIFQKYNK